MDRMIIAKGQPKTHDIKSYKYNEITHKWDVTYNSGKQYSYSYNNIEVLKNPRIVDTDNVLYFDENRSLYLRQIFYH